MKMSEACPLVQAALLCLGMAEEAAAAGAWRSRQYARTMVNHKNAWDASTMPGTPPPATKPKVEAVSKFFGR